jgi:hypothetical protein
MIAPVMKLAASDAIMGSLRYQAHPQGRANTADGIEARLCIGPQCFVQRLVNQRGQVRSYTDPIYSVDLARRWRPC